MLTRQDRTITDCLAVLDLILPLKLRHIGFKDVGVDKKTLATLADRIRKSGATTYMEVVSTSPADALNSARVAVELGIDRLLGGTDVARVQEILGDRQIGYYPFCGFPTGHPTKLGGRPDQIEAHCRRFVCLLYTSDAADDTPCVDLGGRRIIKKSFFSSRRRHTRSLSVSWARRCV